LATQDTVTSVLLDQMLWPLSGNSSNERSKAARERMIRWTDEADTLKFYDGYINASGVKQNDSDELDRKFVYG